MPGDPENSSDDWTVRYFELDGALARRDFPSFAKARKWADDEENGKRILSTLSITDGGSR